MIDIYCENCSYEIAQIGESCYREKMTCPSCGTVIIYSAELEITMEYEPPGWFKGTLQEYYNALEDDPKFSLKHVKEEEHKAHVDEIQYKLPYPTPKRGEK